MPVGFENSALKMSFSLSSLQPSSASLESPEHARLRSERPYNSLTKKPRKDPEQETWRRSWGSRDGKEEFWAALQPNYTYLMDNHLIDSCQEAWAEASYDWSYNEFTCQFGELYAWLNGIQEGVYGKEENVTDRGLRLSHVEEMQRNAYRRKVFNERSSSLLERSPQLSEEVTWRVSHINSKWDMLEQTLTTPVKVNPDQEDVCTDVEHEVRCLRKWLSEMETRLQPLDFRTRWSPQELEEKAREHVVLQRDVESHGKIVCSVVKLCERISHIDARTRRRYDATDAARVAQRLESRWHHLYLRSLEWTYYIETLAAEKLGNNSPGSVGASESDEEPVSKHPRLCHAPSPVQHQQQQRRPTDAHDDDDDGDASCEDDGVDVMDTSPPPPLDVASSPTMVGTKRRNVVSREDIQALEDRVAASLPTASHRLVIGGQKAVEAENGVLSTTRWAGGSSFNRSNREAPNYATFYFKHLDTDSEQDARNNTTEVAPTLSPSGGGSGNEKSQEDSSEEEWTFTCGIANDPGGKAENETSSSCCETATTSPRKKGSFVVRLDFSGDETLEMGVEDKLVYENNQNVNGTETNGHHNGVYKHVDRMCGGRRNSRESIQRLVIQAEEMVASPDKMAAAIRAARVFEPLIFGGDEKLSSSNQAKHTRIKEWLQVHLQNDERSPPLPPIDSCDASGEYTTGDSDEEKESQSSEELNGSVATCRQVEILLGCSSRSGSIVDVDATTPQGDKTSPLRTPSHVVMRAKRRQTSCDRPWSVSGVPQGMVDATPTNCDPLAHFSISESALNEIVGTPKKGPATSGGSGVINVSSSTIDGSPLMGAETGTGVRTESLRRRKLRTRKRMTGRKSESGSDCVTVGHSGSDSAVQRQAKSHSRPGSGVEGSPRHVIAKSGSFSGTNSPRRVSDRSTNSDPVAMLKDETTSTTSSSDSGEEDQQRGHTRLLPSFKLGPEGGPVSSFLSPADKNMALGVEEHHSSLSEQAWDNYQEKYMSEPYSEELADNEAARRLLEFGDDYRNFIDSQSDCASSLSANQVPSPVRRRRATGVATECNLLDSDSDLEDIKHLMQQSRSQLVFTEHVFSKQLAKASPELVLATDFAEIGATCRENILCLRTILENVDEDEGGLLSAHECKEIRGLVERWDMLQGRTEDLQRVRALQREMASLKDELLDLASRVGGMEASLENRDQLENHINQVKTELTSLRDRKTKLLDVNVAVHRFLTDTGHPAAVLKDDVADLYRVWDETFQSVSQRLGTLQKVSTAWQQFEAHLSELQVALRADQDTLRMLDTALQGGDVTTDVATSVRDVAKVLSEKQEHYDALCQKPSVLNDSTTVTNDASLGSPRSNEGSLSDSGISDEGSEQELSEREKRLEALRRLARHLEGVLAPGSQVLINMAKRIEQTENELRGLQRTCRDLIVRTAVCVEARTSVSAAPTSPPLVASPKGRDTPLRQKPTPRTRRMSSGRKARAMSRMCSADPDDSDPDKRRSWLWRVMRAALPFQMALVALFCVACLLEPHCCDAMNNLNLSLTPQLRYLRGPPPI